MSTARPPTAVMCGNDVLAIGAIAECNTLGIAVPQRVSITGFDDMEIAAHLQPSLTSVNTDVVAWGRAAATRLLEIVHDETPTPVRLPEARLVVRASTGPAPTHPRSSSEPRARRMEHR